MCCSVNGSVCLVCCVFDSICEVFGETICNMFGVVVILLLNVMEVCSVGGGVWSSKEYVCYACDPSMHLSVPSICFVHVFVCRMLSPHLTV